MKRVICNTDEAREYIGQVVEFSDGCEVKEWVKHELIDVDPDMTYQMRTNNGNGYHYIRVDVPAPVLYDPHDPHVKKLIGKKVQYSDDPADGWDGTGYLVKVNTVAEYSFVVADSPDKDNGLMYKYIREYEPNENVLTWDKLKVGDVLSRKGMRMQYMITAIDPDSATLHINLATVGWITDDRLGEDYVIVQS